MKNLELFQESKKMDRYMRWEEEIYFPIDSTWIQSGNECSCQCVRAKDKISDTYTAVYTAVFDPKQKQLICVEKTGAAINVV